MHISKIKAGDEVIIIREEDGYTVSGKLSDPPYEIVSSEDNSVDYSLKHTRHNVKGPHKIKIIKVEKTVEVKFDTNGNIYFKEK